MRIKLIAIALLVCIALSAACTNGSSGTASSANSQSGTVESLKPIPKNAETVSANAVPTKISQGQIVYVPVYSHIYHGNGQEQLLTVTLSIRNTSLKLPLFIRSVRYYDSAGNQVKEYTQGTLRLLPLATTEFLIPQQDASGGSGANFIVEWVAEQPISTPIIEAVMISTSSQQGISFVTSGRVIQEIPPTP
ncbi:Protein of unknown function (DUF3124) [Leptolyngbyaceae cyanobacterium JSC-12]|nr:Protein of unknown function (DUF3124) [Leptolyngbyaceae cyanobacterium JSC-12]